MLPARLAFELRPEPGGIDQLHCQFPEVFMMPAPLFNDGLELPAKRHLATAGPP